MKRPPADDLALAAEWVRAYEEGAEDAERLTAVAAWLDYQAGEAEKAAFVRVAMKGAGATRRLALNAWARLQEKPR